MQWLSMRFAAGLEDGTDHPVSWFGQVRRLLGELHHRDRRRAAHLDLLALDDAALRDLGHCRAQLEWAVEHAYRTDTARALQGVRDFVPAAHRPQVERRAAPALRVIDGGLAANGPSSTRNAGRLRQSGMVGSTSRASASIDSCQPR